VTLDCKYGNVVEISKRFSHETSEKQENFARSSLNSAIAL